MSKEERIEELLHQIRRKMDAEPKSEYDYGHTEGLGMAASIVKLHITQLLDTYAQEITVGFAEWIRTLTGIYPVNDMWHFNGEYITTHQLFQQFLINKNEKK